MWEKLSFVFCFCSLGFKNISCAKNPFYFSTIFEISFRILFSLHEKPQKKFSHKAFIFLFLFSPFFVSLCSFQHFLSSLFSWFTFYISFWFSPLFSSLFSPFFLYFSISVFLLLFFSVSHVSLSFFLHRGCCVSSFYFNSFFFSPFDLDLIFLFILLLYLFFIISASFFCPKKIQKFLWSIFLHEIMSLFFEPSLLRCFISCFFPPRVVLIPCCSMFFWLLALLDSTFLDFLLSTFYLGL